MCLLNLLLLHLHLHLLRLMLLPLLLLLLLFHLLSCSLLFCRLLLALMSPSLELLLMLSVFSFQLLLVLTLALTAPLFVVCCLPIARARATFTFACLLVVLRKLTLPPSTRPRKLFRIRFFLLAPALIPVAPPLVIKVQPALIYFYLARECLLFRMPCLCTLHVFSVLMLGALDLLCLFTQRHARLLYLL